MRDRNIGNKRKLNKTNVTLKFSDKLANKFRDELILRETRAEKEARLCLERYCVTYERQKVFEKQDGKFYIADLYIPESITCIEFDGGYHSTLEQTIKDAERDKWFTDNGYKVRRFKNEDIPLFSVYLMPIKRKEE